VAAPEQPKETVYTFLNTVNKIIIVLLITIEGNLNEHMVVPIV
jgi:hypothetical protein